MEILNELIIGMNKEEVRFYKLYATRTDNGIDRKDLQLFDYIRSSAEKYEEGRIYSKLYSVKDKNSFYRLRHKLIEEVNKSLILQYQESDETLFTHHLISRAILFLKRRSLGPALHFLKKAEASAKHLENYELLDIIYGEFIRLSHEKVDIDPEQFIQKRKENYSRLVSLRQIDDVLAAVSYRVKVSQNFSESKNPILKLLEKTINDFTIDKKLIQSPKLRLSIYSAVSQILLQKRDYPTLEKYLVKTYQSFIKDKIFNKENHNTKLQLLTYLVNAFFKNANFKRSLEYTEELKSAMNEHGKILLNQYLFFYYNSLVINYSVTDKEKAINLLEELKENEIIRKTPFYELFVYLNLAVLWFDKEEFHKSIRELSKLYIHENYKKADVSLRFKIAIAELIIRYELGDIDFLENRIQRVEKEFPEQLKASKRETEFVSILKLLPYEENIRTNLSLQKRINKFVESANKIMLDDSEIIKYSDWICRLIVRK